MNEKKLSSPRKKIASSAVMMNTITVVIIVSRLVGQTTYAVSARTCLTNSPTETLATSVIPSVVTAATARGPGGIVCADVAKGRA